jgi:GntR family transcriptional regulator of vanillate catabolism
MARRLRVGRAAVRVAFDRLAQVGILERIPNAGTFVKRISLEDYCQLMDTRAVLEGLAGRLACDRATTAMINELRRLAEAVDQADDRFVEDPQLKMDSVKEHELNFHSALVKASGNARIARILFEQHLFEDAFSAAGFMPVLKGDQYRRGSERAPSHRHIVEALTQRDHDRVEQMLKQHVLLTKQDQVALHMGVTAPQATRTSVSPLTE